MMDTQSVPHRRPSQIAQLGHHGVLIGAQPSNDPLVFGKPQIMHLQIETLQRRIPAEYPLLRALRIQYRVTGHYDTNSANEPNCSIAFTASSFNLSKYDMSICRSSFSAASIATSASIHR